LFMGEETGETRPFCFFTDFKGELADAVRNGRRREFAHFAAFGGDDAGLAGIPDPNAASTFEASKLDWSRLETDDGKEWLNFLRGLLAIRREKIVPLLSGAGGHAGRVLAADDGLIAVDWLLGNSRLQLRANFADDARPTPRLDGTLVHALPAGLDERLAGGDELPAKSVVVAIAETVGARPQ
jgi:maltooligosyltrehalose trehalohydrolase